MKIGLLICTYNRPEYLSKCLNTIRKTTAITRGDVEILIVDDGSTDIKTRNLIDADWANTIKKPKSSIKDSMLKGCDFFFNDYRSDIDLVINLDGDAIVRSDFIEIMLSLRERFPDNMITGFNCFTKNKNGSERHVVLAHGDGYTKRKSVGGINLMFDKSQYQKWIRPALLKCLKEGGNWDDWSCRNSMADGKEIIACSPSVVQHIGIESSMGHNQGGEPIDFAEDFIDDSGGGYVQNDSGQWIREDELQKIRNFGSKLNNKVYIDSKKLQLPNVTLIGADCVDVNRLIRAADICELGIQFGDVKILSSIPSSDPRVVKIRPLGSKGDYSTFMMKELADYIQTDYMLVFQYDGFVLNPSAWRDEWFNYDYIGAAWEWYKDGMNVGNGGFSFRSKRLHQILKDDNDIVPVNEPGVTKNMEEDHCIARLYRSLLRHKYKINFAPIEEARMFSIEGWNSPNKTWTNQFGFHGHSADISKSGFSIQ